LQRAHLLKAHGHMEVWAFNTHSHLLSFLRFLSLNLSFEWWNNVICVVGNEKSEKTLFGIINTVTGAPIMDISEPNSPTNDVNDRHDVHPLESAETLLASELNNMTVEDRTHVFEEIHGVAQFPQEELSPEKLRKSLFLLAKAIDNIEHKPDYDEAQKIALEEGTTTFVNDDSFRLRFLRVEQFRPQQAAERMIRNLNLISRYVGPKCLTRPIKMSDLGESSLMILKMGSFQPLPSRDRSGRRIVARIGPLGLDFINNEKSVGTLWLCDSKWLIFLTIHAESHTNLRAFFTLS